MLTNQIDLLTQTDSLKVAIKMWNRLIKDTPFADLQLFDAVTFEMKDIQNYGYVLCVEKLEHGIYIYANMYSNYHLNN